MKFDHLVVTTILTNIHDGIAICDGDGGESSINLFYRLDIHERDRQVFVRRYRTHVVQTRLRVPIFKMKYSQPFIQYIKCLLQVTDYT